MDVTAIQERLRAIKDEIGTGKEDVCLRVGVNECSVSIHPHGLTGSSNTMIARASDPSAERALDKALAAYRAKRADADKATTERIALAIISATHRYGECSKSQLRYDFGGDVDRLGDDAVALANSMSEAGPFDLTEDEGRNAA